MIVIESLMFFVYVGWYIVHRKDISALNFDIVFSTDYGW